MSKILCFIAQLVEVVPVTGLNSVETRFFLGLLLQLLKLLQNCDIFHSKNVLGKLSAYTEICYVKTSTPETLGAVLIVTHSAYLGHEPLT